MTWPNDNLKLPKYMSNAVGDDVLSGGGEGKTADGGGDDVMRMSRPYPF